MERLERERQERLREGQLFVKVRVLCLAPPPRPFTSPGARFFL